MADVDTTASNADTAAIPTFKQYKPLVTLQAMLPPFPCDALPNVIREYVEAVALNSQTSVEMAGMISLGVLATALQGKYCVQAPNGHTEPLNMFLAIIAEPGERKSSVMHAMTDCLREYEYAYNDAHKAEILRNRREREDLEYKIAQLKQKMMRKPDVATEMELHHLTDCLDTMPVLAPQRYIADDCTVEALTRLMAQNGGIISVISEEGGIFDNVGGRYNNGQAHFDVLLKGYCGDPIRVDRIGRDEELIQRPTLTMILAVQPVVINQIIQNTAMMGRGLVARILFCSPVSQIGHRSFLSPAIPDAVKAAYTNLINHLMSIPVPREPHALTLTAEANEIMDAYFSAHEKYLAGAGQAIPDWASKYIGTVMRIAGLLHCVGMTDAADCYISATTMTDAIHIGEYLLAQANFTLASAYDDQSLRRAKFVWSKIISMKSSMFKRSVLSSACRGKFFHKTEDLLPTLAQLEEHGYIRQVTPERPGPGKPPDVQIVVNPVALAAEE